MRDAPAEPDPPRPGPGRRLLAVWGFVPGFVGPHRTVALTTRDGVLLEGDYLPGPGGPGRGPAVLLLHGFGAHRRKPRYVALAERLADVGAVLAPDLRGHGRSQGRSTLGDREVHDVRAGVAWLRRAGHPWVAVVGASMGATALLRAAGSSPQGFVDAACAISAPAEFVTEGIPAVRALARSMSSTTWRVGVEAFLRVDIARAWGDPAPSHSLVHRVAPTPLLIVHGRDDRWFPLSHAERLYERAGEPKALWNEPAGFGHAEDGFAVAFAERLAEAVTAVQRTGRWPASVG